MSSPSGSTGVTITKVIFLPGGGVVVEVGDVEVAEVDDVVGDVGTTVGPEVMYIAILIIPIITIIAIIAA